jgi:hypothetical protein
MDKAARWSVPHRNRCERAFARAALRARCLFLLRHFVQDRERLSDRGMADLRPADIAILAGLIEVLAAARSSSKVDKAYGLAGDLTPGPRNPGDGHRNINRSA